MEPFDSFDDFEETKKMITPVFEEPEVVAEVEVIEEKEAEDEAVPLVDVLIEAEAKEEKSEAEVKPKRGRKKKEA